MGTERKKPTRKARIVRTAAGAVLGFVAAVCLAISVLCFTLLWTASESHMHASLKNVNYPEAIVPYLEEELNELAIPSGLPDHFFTGKTDVSVLASILDGSVRANYAGESFSPDTTALAAELREAFWAYAESEGITASEEAVDSLTQLCVNQYIRTGSPTAFAYLAGYAQKISPYVRIAAIVCLAAAAGLTVYLLRIRMRLMVFCAAGGAGAMLFTVPLILLLTGALDRLGLSPEPVRLFAVDYLSNPLIVLSVAGGILMLAAVVLTVLFARRPERERRAPAEEDAGPEPIE